MRIYEISLKCKKGFESKSFLKEVSSKFLKQLNLLTTNDVVHIQISTTTHLMTQRFFSFKD